MTEPVGTPENQRGRVFEKNPVYVRFEERWQKALDAEEGEEAIFDPEKVTTYLPPLSGHDSESDPAYDRYIENAWWYEATGRTVEGLTGIATNVEPTITFGTENDAVREFMGNVTGGNPITGATEDMAAFWRSCVQRLINPGRIGILTDYPEDLGRPLSPDEAERLGRQPVLRIYNALQIWDWRLRRETGSARRRLQWVVLREEASRQVGPGEFEDVNQIRVLTVRAGEPHPRTGAPIETEVYVQEFYDEVEDDTSDPEEEPRWELSKTVVPLVNGEPLDSIPFELRDWSDRTTRPSLMGLINLNIQHLRNTASYERALTLTAEPQPYVIFEPSEEVEVNPEEGQAPIVRTPTEYVLGSETVWEFEGAKQVDMLEYKGQGLEPMEKALEQKERRMAILGARILMPERRQVEATQTAQIHRHGEQSALAKIVQNAAGALKAALKSAALWLNVDPSKVEVEAPVNFQPFTMEPQMLTALLDAYVRGGMDDIDLDRNLKLGQLRDPERKLEEVRTNIENRTPRDVLDAMRTIGNMNRDPNAPDVTNPPTDTPPQDGNEPN